MKICFFIASLGDGGAQRQCIGLLNELQHIPGIEVHLILLRRDVYDDTLDTSELFVHRIHVRDFANPIGLLFVVWTLARIRPAVLVSWLAPADIWAYLATRVVRAVPWVLTERNSAYSDRPDFNLRKRLGLKADAIIANSRQGVAMWRELGYRGRVEHIPNMVLSPIESKGAQDRSGSAQCLSVGRLVPQKGVQTMVRAFIEFAKLQSQSQLTVVGVGPEAAEIAKVAERSGLLDRVHLLGFRRDVPDLMDKSRLLLSFSRHEGMPNVLMEAVAAGLPAVVSDIQEHRALLGDDYPYFVPVGASAREISVVIAKAWDEGPEQCEHHYTHARKVLAGMSREHVLDRYVACLADIATANQGARATETSHPREDP